MGQSSIKLKNGNSFDFDKIKYHKIAEDSLKNIYEKQKEFYSDEINVLNKENAISQKYEINELSFISLPIFKLNKKAKNYNYCEDFSFYIEFKDPLNEQRLMILNSKNEIISLQDLPQFDFKVSSLFPNQRSLKRDKQDYENLVLKQFLDTPSAFPFKLIKQQFVERPNNFFFRILGFRFEIFEIDLNTGELFVNYFGSRREPRLEIKDYLKKYVDKRIIKDIANNIFDTSYAKRKKGVIKM